MPFGATKISIEFRLYLIFTTAPFFKLFKPFPKFTCNVKLQLEHEFWYGTRYMSSGLSITFSLFNLGWFYLIFGLGWNDNSLFYYLITNTSLLIISLPYIMRLSRTAYLSVFVKYDKNAASSKH